MNCPYCGSRRVVVSSGEYVCADCGSVLGPVLYVPLTKLPPYDNTIKKLSIKILLYKLNKEVITSTPIKINQKEKIKKYIESLSKDLEAPEEVLLEAFEVVESIDRRKIQGKNPKVLAAAIFYLVSNRRRLIYDKDAIAKRLGVSKLSVRDAATFLRRICKDLR
ncbi:MAG: TFIIB-type zinc ribbon-containing protein [Thermoproteus sp.]